MTVVAAMLDPPRDGLVLADLPAESPLSVPEATELYRAMAADVLLAVQDSGGDLLVNYRPEDLLPDRFRGETDTDAEAEVRALASSVLDDPGEARFEVQVGSTFSARAGNSVTHLLEREDANSAAVVTPNVPVLGRTRIDGAAMKLRTSEVVLGPAPAGRVYYAAFSEPVDFTDAYAPPELETLTDCGLDADHGVDYLPMLPVVETGEDLVTLVSTLRARRAAGRIVPAYTAALVEDLGLRATVEDGERRVVREG